MLRGPENKIRIVAEDDVEGYRPHFPFSLFQGGATFPLSFLGLAAGKPVPPADVRHGAVLEEDVPVVRDGESIVVEVKRSSTLSSP